MKTIAAFGASGQTGKLFTDLALNEGTYRSGYLDADTGRNIGRADVAAFLLDELKKSQYIRKNPVVSSG